MDNTKENRQRSKIVTAERGVACRRELLKTTGIAVTTGGISTSMITQPAVGVEQADVTIEIDNIGITAWEMTNIDGDENVAEVGTKNPEITLTEGTRYTFKNEAWDNYPLVFRDSDSTEVLSQDGDGEFEDNDAVNWIDNGDIFAFTLTDGLAGNIAEYLAPSYSNMVCVYPEDATAGTA